MHLIKLGPLAHFIALTPRLDLSKKKKKNDGILEDVGGGRTEVGFFFNERKLFTM